MGLDKSEATAEHERGPVIRRQRLVERFLSGEWGVELAGVEQARQRERQACSAEFVVTRAAVLRQASDPAC